MSPARFVAESTSRPTVQRGMRFEHARQLRTDWSPGPGQRYADAPKVTMEITRVATGTAWYRPVGTTGSGFTASVVDMVEGGGVVGRWLCATPDVEDAGHGNAPTS